MFNAVPADQPGRKAHLTHNEAPCGEARFTGSMTAYLPAAIHEFCEAHF